MQTEKTASPTRIKHAGSISAEPAKKRLSWPDVLRAAPRDETRSYVLTRFREAGFTGDSWSERKAREKMASILTAAEDWIEATHPNWKGDREPLRVARRQLELELWP